MSAIDLLQPLLDGGVQRNHFFNGRLLSAEDLRTEQEATRTQLRDHGRAFGDGVACGFGVEIVARGPASPTVRVAPGRAFNRLGAMLRLDEPVDLRLVPETAGDAVLAGLFAACEKPRPMATIAGAGAWVLTASPTSGYRETAPVSDPNATALGRGACGARYSVEGLSFRLAQIPIDRVHGLVPQGIDPSGALEPSLRTRLDARLASTDDRQRERLRNLLAHACYGSGSLGAAFADPSRRYSDAGRQVTDAPVWARWGTLDAMRERGDLTDCDVPLALVVLDAGGIRFLDLWSVRRRPIDAGAVDGWRVAAGGRREAEGEAAFLQFQAQLESVRAAATATAALAARDWFDWLPAAGWLPGSSGGFDWRAFLGEHAPAAVTPVDAALLRGVVTRSWLDEPFALETTPPVPLRVYQVPGDAAVVFARSPVAQLRVRFTPAPSAEQAITASVQPRTGSLVTSTVHAAGRMLVGELPPGRAALSLVASDYAAIAAQDVELVGGRTIDVGIALSPIENGTIVVTTIDAASERDIAAQVTSLSATGPHPAATVRHGSLVNGRWVVAHLPAGRYGLAAAAGGYRSTSASDVGPVPSTGTFAFTLRFEPTAKTPQPERCIAVDALEGLKAKKLRLCMVLPGTAFEREAFEQASPTRAAKASAPTVKFAAAQRQKKQPGFELAADGELLYDGGDPPWSAMVPVKSEPKPLTTWLAAWRDWLAIAFGDERMFEAKPVLYVDRRFKGALNDEVGPRDTPPAWAVFGRFGVPVSIGVDEGSTRGPVLIRDAGLKGVPPEIHQKLEDHDIRTVNDVVWIWDQIMVDITGEREGLAEATIREAARRVAEINAEKSYYGLDKASQDKLDAAGLATDEQIAKATLAKLTEVLGSKALAIQVQAQAKRIVRR